MLRSIIASLISLVILSCSPAFADPLQYPTTNSFSGDNSADATTATITTIIAAATDLNIRPYVTLFNCVNTGATATRVYLTDSAGTKHYANCFLVATSGQCNVPIPSAARFPKGSAVRVETVTAGGAVRCSAAGFFSMN